MWLASLLTRTILTIKNGVAELAKGNIHEKNAVKSVCSDLQAIGDTLNDVSDTLSRTIGAIYVPNVQADFCIIYAGILP